MSLVRSQAVVTVEVARRKFREVPQVLARALEPYPNARIVSLTQTADPFSDISVLVAIEYTPGGHDG